MDYTFILRLLTKAVGVLAAGDVPTTLSFRISLYRGRAIRDLFEDRELTTYEAQGL